MSTLTYYVFPITYKTASVLCQSECASLKQTVNMLFFILKIIKIPTSKEETLMQCTELLLIYKERICFNMTHYSRNSIWFVKSNSAVS